MKTAKVNAVAQHVVLNTLIASAKRMLKQWQIWCIDSQYRALGDYVQELQVNQVDAERARVALLIRRVVIRADMRDLGGN